MNINRVPKESPIRQTTGKQNAGKDSGQHPGDIGVGGAGDVSASIQNTDDINAGDINSNDISSDDKSDSKPPRLKDHYLGLLVWIHAKDAAASRALAGAECCVGSQLSLLPSTSDTEQEGQEGQESHQAAHQEGHEDQESQETHQEDQEDPTKLYLSSRMGTIIGSLDAEQSDKVAQALQKGWECWANVELIAWDKKHERFSAQVAIVCHNPSDEKINTSIKEFERRLTTRIRGGDYPDPVINQESFEKIINSNGAWYMVPRAAKPKKSDGTSVSIYRKRQTLADKLAEASINHRAGCTVASYAFIAVIIAVIVLLIWFL